jgi:hypothetical protein
MLLGNSHTSPSRPSVHLRIRIDPGLSELAPQLADLRFVSSRSVIEVIPEELRVLLRCSRLATEPNDIVLQ